MKFATTSIQHYPPHLRLVATLPWETKNSNFLHIYEISYYFERSVVTVKLRKEYLNIGAYNTPVLLPIKYWTVLYIKRYSMSTYTGVSNFQKQSGFWPTLYN